MLMRGEPPLGVDGWYRDYRDAQVHNLQVEKTCFNGPAASRL